MNKNRSYFIVLAGLFVALGIVFPFVTGGIPVIGQKLLPMHIPVLLCGFVCGPVYGALAGVLTPILRSMLFGAPVMVPMAVSMAFELAAYGFFSGFLYKKVGKIYIALIGAMLGGRVIMGIINIFLYSSMETAYSWQLFMAGAFLNAIPGIIIQLVLVPILVVTLKKARVIKECEQKI